MLKDLLTGAVFGALITGLLKIVGDLITRRGERAALTRGFAAEIRAGLNEVLTTPPSDEEATRFLASNGLPYEFYESNKDKIGLTGTTGAERVVSYHSLRWQLYAAGQTSGSVERLKKLLSATHDSAKDALRIL